MAQKCRPQYCFRNCGNSCWRMREVRPLSRLTKSDSAVLGGYSISMWTWSLLTTPLSIRTSSALNISLEHLVAVLGDPDQMRRQSRDRVAAVSMLRHRAGTSSTAKDE